MSCRTQEEVLRLRDLKVAPHFYGKTFFCFKGEMHAVGRGKPKPLNQLPGPLEHSLMPNPTTGLTTTLRKTYGFVRLPDFLACFLFFLLLWCAEASKEPKQCCLLSSPSPAEKLPQQSTTIEEVADIGALRVCQCFHPKASSLRGLFLAIKTSPG